MKNLKLAILLLFCVILGQFFVNAWAQENETIQDNGICSKKEIIFSQKVYPINAIDPTILTNATGSFYPGLRGSNQMVVYTPAFGFRTNTNEFGAEAIVKGNIVTSLSGADSIIPSDGLVISGHGIAKKWMNENIILGSKIYVNRNDKTLTVYITSDSFIYGAKEKIKEAQSISGYYRDLSYMYDHKKSGMYIDKAKDYLKKAERNPQDVQKYSTMAIDSANLALANALPYKADELKGVWVRPTETTPEAITATLDRIKSAGIDNVFLETYFHGKTIFPSKIMESYGFTYQNEKFAGFDPLKIWIEEAHKKNIKVHIWFETFYVGNNGVNDNKSILAVCPCWGNKTKRDFDSPSLVPSLSEHGGYFLDPANPDVQMFLECLLTEIVCNYHPDGINLDYIRYPQSIAAKFSSYDLSNWGYTEYARNDFKRKYAKDPIDIAYSDPLWLCWDRYRQDKVTAFVSRISNLAKRNNITLTTVIFPDRQKALETKQQDWRTWSALGYVDGFTPLLLTCDAKTASAMMQDIIRNKTRNTNLYAGLFITFMGGANEDLLRQIHEARKVDAKGIIVFDYAHLNDNYAKTLTTSVFDANQLKPEVLQCNTPFNYKKRRFFWYKS
ncbi:MAG: family 10 glycosylhydrolase [Candidatus Gastranaerophilales bacterium]|nr:family 10 glycosylhydrolase [Candidatus Gastranaerophilales bacterium]